MGLFAKLFNLTSAPKQETFEGDMAYERFYSDATQRIVNSKQNPLEELAKFVQEECQDGKKLTPPEEAARQEIENLLNRYHPDDARVQLAKNLPSKMQEALNQAIEGALSETVSAKLPLPNTQKLER